MTRKAISPRLAMRTFENIEKGDGLLKRSRRLEARGCRAGPGREDGYRRPNPWPPAPKPSPNLATPLAFEARPGVVARAGDALDAQRELRGARREEDRA